MKKEDIVELFEDLADILSVPVLPFEFKAVTFFPTPTTLSQLEVPNRGATNA